MDSTKLVLKLIRKNFKSIRQFAIAADIPYSTVKSGLKSGIEGMAVETVIKMCSALHIQVENLIACHPEPSGRERRISADEHDLLRKYRALSPQSQQEIRHYLEYRYEADSMTNPMQ